MFKILSKFADEKVFTPLCDEPMSAGAIACFKAENNLSFDVSQNCWYDRDEFCARDNFYYQFINLDM